jgi:hypothetical protein
LVVKRTVKSPVVKAAGVGGVGQGGLGGSGSSEERVKKGKKGKKRKGQQGLDIRRVVGACEQEDESGSVVVVVGKTRKM